jgi:DNA-directed RNA polymerase specialized sigma subunit
MKKQTLEEQVSRIKGMIKSVDEGVHTDDEKESYQEFDISQDRKDTIVMRVFLNMLLKGLYGVEDIERLVTRDRHLSDESKNYILKGDDK